MFADLSSSPPGPYGQEQYIFRPEEHFKAPPILPPHLLQVILNKDTNVSVSVSSTCPVATSSHLDLICLCYCCSPFSLWVSSRQCDPALLPEPNHVMLNHLYALSIKVGSLEIAATSHAFPDLTGTTQNIILVEDSTVSVCTYVLQPACVLCFCL